MANSDTTRRDLLGAIAAAPLAALAIPAAGFAKTSSSTVEWDAALAAFREADAVHTALWGRWEQASEAADNNTPDRVDRYFDDYRLGMSMSRGDVEYWLRHYNTGRGESRIDIDRTADEFAAYQRVHHEARERFQTERLYEEAHAHSPVYQEARDALMEIPAPTVAALLIKMEIAAVSLDDEHAESVLADTRRLMSAEAGA